LTPLQGRFDPFLTPEQGITIDRIRIMIDRDLVAKMAPSLFDRGADSWFTREPVHNIDQLGVRAAGRIAEFIDRVCIGKPAQPGELADPLPPV
jgi:hypothetical protein